MLENLLNTIAAEKEHHPLLMLAPFLLPALFFILLQIKSSVKRDLSRIAKGIHINEKKLSAVYLQKKMKKIKSAASDNGTVFGVSLQTAEPVVLHDHDANLHTLAIGTTGSGKTTALANFVESSIIRRWPLFYVDGKGDLAFAKSIEAFAKSHNTPFYLFSMVGESVKYNPISFGGFTSKKDRIIELREWSEDHYRKLAEGYLQTVFKILERANINVNLCTLSRYLELPALYQLARELKDPALKFEIDSLENKRKDIESLIAEIQNIANSEIGHLFDCNDDNVLTLEKALHENAVVYFCLQPLAFPAYASTLGKLIINDLKSLIASQLKNQIKKNIFTIFDEFSVFAGDQIINLINQGRGAGVHAILATQSLSDIERKGEKGLLGQVLNNTNNYIIQRQNYPDDAEILASIIGTTNQFTITSQIAPKGSTGAGSIRETKEFIIHPDKIKRLDRGEAIFVNKQGFAVHEIIVRKGFL